MAVSFTETFRDRVGCSPQTAATLAVQSRPGYGVILALTSYALANRLGELKRSAMVGAAITSATLAVVLRTSCGSRIIRQELAERTDEFAIPSKAALIQSTCAVAAGYLLLARLPLHFGRLSSLITRTLGFTAGGLAGCSLIPLWLLAKSPEKRRKELDTLQTRFQCLTEVLKLSSSPMPSRGGEGKVGVQIALTELVGRWLYARKRRAQFHQLVDTLEAKMGERVGDHNDPPLVRLQALQTFFKKNWARRNHPDKTKNNSVKTELYTEAQNLKQLIEAFYDNELA